MNKIVTTIECTPEELVSRVAKAVDKRIEALHNQTQKKEAPALVPEVSQFLGRSQNWTRREAASGRERHEALHRRGPYAVGVRRRCVGVQQG